VAHEPGGDEVEGLDEEFLYHLNRGADLLSKGEAEYAKRALARARELRPRDPQVLGLLGQSLYKLGRFDEAIEAYGALVAESPVESAARVNLGLANLKAKRFAEAVQELTIALDLNPTHKKAMGYLGLAWLEQKDYARARDWFDRAGSEQMVARCDELLHAARAGDAGAAGGEGGAVAQAAAQAEPVPLEHHGEAAYTEPPPHLDDAVAPPPEVPAEVVRAVPAFRFEQIAPAPLADPADPFVLEDGFLSIAVAGEGVVARADGLVAARGALELRPELKRFRGRPTEKAFGEGARRMLRARGEGALLYAPGDARFVAVELGGASAYLREEAVFAMEGSLVFDNGRVTSRAGPDLNLVHARGEGRVLVGARGEVRAIPVAAGAPVRVPIDALVGWTGAVTPRLGALAAGAPDEPPGPGEPYALELSGDGRVLVDGGARAAARR
jgi:uncharacterized protein (AIM24 family)